MEVSDQNHAQTSLAPGKLPVPNELEVDCVMAGLNNLEKRKYLYLAGILTSYLPVRSLINVRPAE
jgi:hypothetical protein